MHPNRNAMLSAMGIVRYRREALRATAPIADARQRGHSVERALDELGVSAPVQSNVRAQRDIDSAPVIANVIAENAPQANVASVLKPAAVSKAREPATRAECVLPAAELQRFAHSKLYQHLQHTLQLEAVPVVENSVLSDTALYFELPGTSKLKLGALSVLRQTWRAKRQAWLAIRLWRKAAKG
jgi:hypothetical protein